MYLVSKPPTLYVNISMTAEQVMILRGLVEEGLELTEHVEYAERIGPVRIANVRAKLAALLDTLKQKATVLPL